MIKKFLLMVIILGMSVIGFADEVDVSQIAVDYPHKENAIRATVLGHRKINGTLLVMQKDLR